MRCAQPEHQREQSYQGDKGADECGTAGALAAAMNAINDALYPLGIRNMPMPATPDRVWQAIRAAKTKAA